MAKGRWCSSCTRVVAVEQTSSLFICCTRCGKVLDADIYSTEATFVKDAAGRSQRDGNLVSTIERESRERTLDKAYDTIVTIADDLGVSGGDQICLPAKRFYAMALEKNFTRGRRADHVAAACLYIACRVNDKPFLLIEFSEILRVNVYVLGGVFLQLCKLLQLAEHPIIQKLVDPSLFVRRFVNGLLGEDNHDVENTALRIIASMKRDWMQTGRKPSGICGAALYIAALSHGFKFSKTDVVRIVHICEATLTKRLIEFEETGSGCLTIEEFNKEAEDLEKKAQEMERSIKSLNKKFREHNHLKSVCETPEEDQFLGEIKTTENDQLLCEKQPTEKDQLLCQHRGTEARHHAHGLCGECYLEFIKISGGLDGGSEPPAFQRAERERLAESLDASGSDQLEKACSIGLPAKHDCTDGFNKKSEYMVTEGDESDTFSDIDDAEVDGYLHNEEEKHYKKIIWEDLNRDYLEEQAKKAAHAAKMEAELAKYQNYSEETLAAHKFAVTACTNAAKMKKERQQKRAAEARTPQTAAEAAHQILMKKRISSKVNYDKLKELFDEHDGLGNPKKSRTEVNQGNDVPQTKKNEAEAQNNEDEFETVDEYEANSYGEYQDQTYYNFEEEYEDFGDEEY